MPGISAIQIDRKRTLRWVTVTASLVASFSMATRTHAQVKQPATGDIFFAEHVKPILEAHCVRCHNEHTRKGKLALDTFERMNEGGASGKVVVPGDPEESELIWAVRGPEPEMPKKAPALSKQQVATLAKWIKDKAPWPKGLTLQDRPAVNRDWWSLKSLQKPAMPKLPAADAKRVRTPIDAFILATLREKKLTPSLQADKRTLIRRLFFDLIGLPPTPTEVVAFVADPDSKAYEKLVDRLLASPRYGERWARHWLDVAHYGDTHGYDKDKLRPNAWPYRDYVIRAFNEDKPFARFVQEQVAGDVLWPNTTDGIVATGFLAAGPWDFIGHAEVPESKIDGKVARHTDRDDMVRTVLEGFTSTTVGCAQCHHHKFDPITMEDYYSLHAVFAALDRADRPYELDPANAAKRGELVATQKAAEKELAAIDKAIRAKAGPQFAKLNERIAVLEKARDANKKVRAEFGYHSGIERSRDKAKWVQVDLGESTALDHVTIVACHDDFQGIGAGFGFPVRFKIELSDDATFKNSVTLIADHTAADYVNPRVTPQRFEAKGHAGRYIRVTATKLVNRMPTDYIFSLAELMAVTPDGKNIALGKTVTSLDSIQAPVRWRRSNLVDGYYYGVWSANQNEELVKLQASRQSLLDELTTAEVKAKRKALSQTIVATKATLSKLPAQAKVYAGCVHQGGGNFRGRAGLGPRDIHLLNRGQVTQPGEKMSPGVPDLIPNAAPRFKLTATHGEGDRRVALAKWLTRQDHPLTWRSIVNRIWLYHFGRGIVDSPNDFGRMGRLPTHPALLDWLAAEFRDGGQSIKQLHRLIVLSSTYQQVSQGNTLNEQADKNNRFLWRMNRRQLEAEAVRDSVLFVSGKLRDEMGGPGFQDFVIEKPQHSPHFMYGKYNPDDVKTHRRSVYRFIVRSQPQPFMSTLDCADPSQMVGKRNHTVTALQALALMNNHFMLRMCEHWAARLTTEHKAVHDQVSTAFRSAIGRTPTADEVATLRVFAKKHGMPATCRAILNLNEFVFID